MHGLGVDLRYDVTDGGTIPNGNGAMVKRFPGPMPILIAKEPEPAFVPFTETPILPPPATNGGTPVITQPISDIPATPDVLPWWERIATAIVPGTDKVGSFGPPGDYFGPQVEPTVSAAGPDKTPMMAGMFGDIPPALRNLMLVGVGLFLLSQLAGKGR